MWAKIWGLTGIVLLGAAISVSGFLYTPTVPDMTVVHVPKVQTIEIPEPEVKTETKTVVVYKEEPRVRASEVVIPSSPEEQQKQLDQATIKNIEQDARLDGHDKLLSTPAIVTTDFCSNIEGSQTVIPSGMVSDGQGGCVVPAPKTYYVAPSKPDTTAPKISVYSHYTCWYNGNYDCLPINQEFQPVNVSIRERMNIVKALSVVTDESTTVKVYFMPVSDNQGMLLEKFSGMNGDEIMQALRNDFSGAILFTDSTMDTVHNIDYVTAGLEKGVRYRFRIEYTDRSGNTSVYGFSGAESDY